MLPVSADEGPNLYRRMAPLVSVDEKHGCRISWLLRLKTSLAARDAFV